MQMQEKPNLHRCGLREIFFMMSCASLCLVSYQWMAAAENSIFDMAPVSSLMTVAWRVDAILHGIAMAALISVAGSRLGHGERLNQSPADWLLLTIVACGFIQSLGRFSLLCYAVLSGTTPEVETMNAIPCASFAAEILILAIAILINRAPSWRVAFACLAFACLMDLAFMLNGNYLHLPIRFIWNYTAIPMQLAALTAALIMVCNSFRENTAWHNYVAIAVWIFISFVRNGGLAHLSPLL